MFPRCTISLVLIIVKHTTGIPTYPALQKAAVEVELIPLNSVVRGTHPWWSGWCGKLLRNDLCCWNKRTGKHRPLLPPLLQGETGWHIIPIKKKNKIWSTLQHSSRVGYENNTLLAFVTDVFSFATYSHTVCGRIRPPTCRVSGRSYMKTKHCEVQGPGQSHFLTHGAEFGCCSAVLYPFYKFSRSRNQISFCDKPSYVKHVNKAFPQCLLFGQELCRVCFTLRSHAPATQTKNSHIST